MKPAIDTRPMLRALVDAGVKAGAWTHTPDRNCDLTNPPPTLAPDDPQDTTITANGVRFKFRAGGHQHEDKLTVRLAPLESLGIEVKPEGRFPPPTFTVTRDPAALLKAVRSRATDNPDAHKVAQAMAAELDERLGQRAQLEAHIATLAALGFSLCAHSVDHGAPDKLKRGEYWGALVQNRLITLHVQFTGSMQPAHTVSTTVEKLPAFLASLKD